MTENLTKGGIVPLWGRFEAAFQGPEDGNPFVDINLSAVFRNGDQTINVPGFYDGEGQYLVRFMPEQEGEWTFETSSNHDALNGRVGAFSVGPAQDGNRGPVRVADKHFFGFADGARFFPFGTTAYAWNHQGEAMEQETLASLKASPFNKIRMCVFPKHYRYNEVEPETYPFKLLQKGDSTWGGKSPVDSWKFDFDAFNPAFFAHLEDRIQDLAEIGVQADLILLHPYDRWGFANMSKDQDDRYLRYVVARLASFPNVWWSMANEYDFMATKTLADWDRMIDVVATADPSGHLLSIHNGFEFYDARNPQVTHGSIQRGDTTRAAYFRKEYDKPIMVDECGYEGNVPEWWGNISALELVHRIWSGTVNGGYVTHGESFLDPEDKLWWGKGGHMVGESVARIAFLKRLMEDGPQNGLEPMSHSGTYRMAVAGGIDDVRLGQLKDPEPGEEDWPAVSSMYAAAGQKHEYYLTYFGQNQPGEYAAVVPPGEDYSATLIDIWDMTETPLSSKLQRGDVLRFPQRPYQAIVLKRVHA